MAVTAFLGERLSVAQDSWFDYDLGGRSSKRDRERVHDFFGFRPIGVADERRLCDWLETKVAPKGMEPAQLRIAVSARDERSCNQVPYKSLLMDVRTGSPFWR